jgi:hypothetical protein
MSSAWFGLIGVVVGGLISTLWQWLAVVRQELSEAMVAARLVDEDLRGVEQTLSQDAAIAKPDTSIWLANRVALDRGLGQKQWGDVADAYRVHAGTSGDARGTPRESLKAARDAIEPLVKGKRYVLTQRWHNFVAKRTPPSGSDSRLEP